MPYFNPTIITQSDAIYVYIAEVILHLLQTYVTSPCLFILCILVTPDRWLLVISKINLILYL